MLVGVGWTAAETRATGGRMNYCRNGQTESAQQSAVQREKREEWWFREVGGGRGGRRKAQRQGWDALADS